MKTGDLFTDRYLLLKIHSEEPLVYICMDQSTQKMVVLRHEATASLARQEFAVLQTLAHPNLPKALEEIESEAGTFLVIDYAPGTSLAEYVATDPSRKLSHTVDMARALVSVLTYLGQQDPPLVCRSLDPTHIVRRKNGQLTLVDAGLVPVGSPLANEPGAHPGPFTAPEQAVGPTTVRSNTYALGALIDFLARGQTGDSETDLTAAIRALMASNPDDRPATFEALSAVLARPLTPVPTPRPEATPAAPPVLSPAPADRQPAVSFGVARLTPPSPVSASKPPPAAAPMHPVADAPEPASVDAGAVANRPAGGAKSDTQVPRFPLAVDTLDAPSHSGDTSKTDTHEATSPTDSDTQTQDPLSDPATALNPDDSQRAVTRPYGEESDPAIAMATLRSGTILNERFRIEGVIGEGGMGAVYLATHLELDQKIAIKEMRLSSHDPQVQEVCVRQFKIEARILNRLRHPNLPRVYDFFQTRQRYYLVMDFILGETLEDVPEPSPDTVLRWAGELCNVLSYLHAQEPPVIFRDLKPANIMQNTDGSIRLIDFGIAKVFDKDKEAAGTRTMMHGFGSHGYAAPEQYGENTDQRVDVYGLGATLYSLLSGLVPPPSVDRVAGIGNLIPLRSTRPDIPEQVDQAIDWMMKLPRNQRPQSIDECRRALGLSLGEGPTERAAPRRIRQLLQEEFQHFFPAPWIDVGGPLRELEAAVTGSMAPPLVQVIGPSGAGKTRLLSELVRRAASTVRILPTVRGQRMARQRPLGALWPALSALVEQMGKPLLLALMYRLDAAALLELSQFFPQLKELQPSALPTPLSSLERSKVLMDACRATIEEALTLDRSAAAQRWVWCFDDAHWMDPASMRLLGTLMEREVPLTIVLASEPNVANDAAHEAVTRWKKRSRVVDLSIETWNQEAVGNWLQATLPPVEGLSTYVPALHQASGGNALMLEELSRWLVTRRFIQEHEGALHVRPFQSQSLPSTVLEAIRGRAELLTLETRQMLATAAVIGPRFDLEALGRLFFGADNEADNAPILTASLGPAAEGQFVRAQDGVWEFISEPTRLVFYERLNDAERRDLHRTMGQLEEASGKPPLTSDRAFHLEQAGDVEGSLLALSELSRELLTPTTVEAIIREGPGNKVWGEVSGLSPQQLDRMVASVAGMSRSLKSLGRYGPDSPIVQTSLDSTMLLLMELQAESGTLLYSVGDHFYSLNGHELDARQMPTELAVACRRHHISGFELNPGLDAVELTRFLTLLSASHDAVTRDGNWATTLRSRQITTIQVIENVLVEVSERDLFDPIKLRLAQEVVLKTETRSAEEGPDGLVSGRAVSSQLESIKEMLEQARSGAPGPRAMAREDPDFDEAWGWLSKQAQREEIMRLAALARQVDRPLMAYLEERPEHLLPLIESDDRDQRVLGAMSLLHSGAAAAKVLVNYLATSDSVTGRTVALFVLTRGMEHAETLIIQRLVESFDEHEVVRLLNALREARLPWEHILELLLLSASSAVRWATARHLVAADVDVMVKTEIFRKSLKADNLLALVDTLRGVGELGEAELVPDVGRLLDRGWSKSTPESLRVQVQACHVLSHIGGPESVLPILRPIVSKGYKAALLGGWESEVRCAATLAIGRLHCDEGRELLATLIKDADAGVRSAAQLALSLAPSQERESAREEDSSLQVP